MQLVRKLKNLNAGRKEMSDGWFRGPMHSKNVQALTETTV